MCLAQMTSDISKSMRHTQGVNKRSVETTRATCSLPRCHLSHTLELNQNNRADHTQLDHVTVQLCHLISARLSCKSFTHPAKHQHVTVRISLQALSWLQARPPVLSPVSDCALLHEMFLQLVPRLSSSSLRRGSDSVYAASESYQIVAAGDNEDS